MKMTQRRELRGNWLDFFETPDEIAHQMARSACLSSLPPMARICDPHCGRGALLLAARANRGKDDVILDGIELSHERAQSAALHGFNVIHGDMLEHSPDDPYDVLLANPPFAVKGKRLAWMDHIFHMWRWLTPDGHVEAIVPDGWTEERWHTSNGDGPKRRAFYEFVEAHGVFTPLPPGTFKASGTNAATVLLSLDKNEDRRAPYRRWPSWHAYHAIRYLEGAPVEIATLPIRQRTLIALSLCMMSPLYDRLTPDDWHAIEQWDTERTSAPAT